MREIINKPLHAACLDRNIEKIVSIATRLHACLDDDLEAGICLDLADFLGDEADLLKEQQQALNKFLRFAIDLCDTLIKAGLSKYAVPIRFTLGLG